MKLACMKLRMLASGSLVPRPKQPQRRSLAVSRGEGGSGHLTAGNADLRNVDNFIYT